MTTIKTHGILELIEMEDGYVVSLPAGMVECVIWSDIDNARELAEKIFDFLVKEGVC